VAVALRIDAGQCLLAQLYRTPDCRSVVLALPQRPSEVVAHHREHQRFTGRLERRLGSLPGLQRGSPAAVVAVDEGK
jgi:hypothetical protein